jgi:DNA replication protein DnaD
MSIMPQGEDLRKAVQWISDQRKDNPSISLAKVIEEASFTFNLSPAEAQYLERWVRTDGQDG